MVESISAPKISSELSAADRLTLIQTLNALPSAQFEELLIALNPPKGNIPSDTAAQAKRSKALFEWIESPIGPGILELEALLGRIIATQSQSTPEFLSFAISGKISSTTVTEVKAIVELLRKKTGDNSIDVAFFKAGSINIILSGSQEGLERLQQLFESGELTKLEIPYIEAVDYIDNSNIDARKARLVQTLRLVNNHSLNQILVSARRLGDALSNAQSNDRYRVESGSSALEKTFKHIYYHPFDKALHYSSKLVSALIETPPLIKNALENTHKIIRELARGRDKARLGIILTTFNPIFRARARLRARACIRFREQAFELSRELAQINTRNHTLDIQGANLKNTNLRNINLKQANLATADFTGADLSNANLTEANLTGANFTGANVTKTIFGQNLGLTEVSKRDLHQRGAILLDPPSSDVPILAQR